MPCFGTTDRTKNNAVLLATAANPKAVGIVHRVFLRRGEGIHPPAVIDQTVILNLSASNEVVGKAAYRRQLVVGQSGRLCCGYVGM